MARVVTVVVDSSPRAMALRDGWQVGLVVQANGRPQGRVNLELSGLSLLRVGFMGDEPSERLWAALVVVLARQQLRRSWWTRVIGDVALVPTRHELNEALELSGSKVLLPDITTVGAVVAHLTS